MHQNYCTNPFRYNSQSSSLIRMKAVLGSPFTAFQPPFKIAGPNLNSAIRSSSNSSTLSLTMVKFSNADLLVGVITKSLNVFTTSVRPNSAMKDNNNYDCGLPCYYIPRPYVSLEHCQTPVLQNVQTQLAQCWH